MGFQLVIWSHFNYCGRSFDQAPTLSLRGPAQFTHEARSAELLVVLTDFYRNFEQKITTFHHLTDHQRLRFKQRTIRKINVKRKVI